ncbi:hypothetical protein [Mycoplasma sp. OR1901]|uniref:hypothetical protein n=1 Tax=Mycoplasma sp. OR1901 TaxID=2742195 RepID=UPI0015842F22|nr:hypothetical protein [Mycoplasma sp. OR1901]QKT05565.1 hypothetical protein HTZ87_02515 [Mycoplasma sp. OR1901]
MDKIKYLFVYIKSTKSLRNVISSLLIKLLIIVYSIAMIISIIYISEGNTEDIKAILFLTFLFVIILFLSIPSIISLLFFKKDGLNYVETKYKKSKFMKLLLDISIKVFFKNTLIKISIIKKYLDMDILNSDKEKQTF